MKIRYIILFFLLIGTLSCKKALHMEPTDIISIETYFDSEDKLNKGLVGVYDILGSHNMYGDLLLHQLSAGNDEYYMMWSQLPFRLFASYRYGTNDVYMTNFWKTLYDGINRANVMLVALDGDGVKQVPEARKNIMRAEVKFLRAYYYSMLAERWGGVPMPLKPTTDANDVALARTPLVDLYKQILTDMEFAEEVLPSVTVLGQNSSGRVSKNTVRGILARVCLSMAGFPLNDATKYAEALKWTTAIMNAGENQLHDSYSDLFALQSREEYFVREQMWEVEFKGNVTDNTREQGYVGVRNGNPANGGAFPGYGYGFMRPTGLLFKRYPLDQASLATDPTSIFTNDTRRDRNIAPFSWAGGNGTPQALSTPAFYTRAQTYDRYPAKWRRDEEVTLPRFKNGNGTNYPLLRYADVLLMFAEAENHVNGPTAAAYNAINEVRKRAYGKGNRVVNITLNDGGTGYTAVPFVTVSPSSDNGSTTALATATVAGGRVTGIVLVTRGAFYNAVPTVSITSSNNVGTGATATAAIMPIDPNEGQLQPGLSKERFLEELQDERSRELAYEGRRTLDLRRWGILIKNVKASGDDFRLNAPVAFRPMGSEASDFITERHLYLPIPSVDVVLNKAIVQNPGW
ncbi:MAG: RagB/SusD family nutrient uptake outer membrane protein [Pedobacter sp.]|nr:MAG: RagB/SusD family nutrient uptake outer membrane protein [Pedobacter sp.]